MCRREWTVIYWMCNDLKDRSFVLVPDDGCGGCGEVTAASFYPTCRFVLEPCPECVANQEWVTLDDIWMPRELADERGWRPASPKPAPASPPPQNQAPQNPAPQNSPPEKPLSE